MDHTGLLLVMVDIDPAIESEFNRWYDEEHVPERMAIPGFVRARRFRAVEGEPKYLALYEVKSPEVLETEVYKAWLAEDMTEWTKSMVAKFENFSRIIYRRIT